MIKPMRCLSFVSALLMGTFFISPYALAQDAKPRPKTCLVLSGGGALGIAHVGVIKFIEEQNIPIDCIAGTSMGSIIGALYASGYTSSEMEYLVKSSQWVDLFVDEAPRSEKTYQRKQDDRNFLVKHSLRFSDKGSPVLPRGFIQGNKIDLSFLEFTLRSRNVEHFDDLRIPFRAVATDLETGEEVILEKGSLAQSMKASMSLPGIFPPMMIDGRSLVDGGMVKNIPVDIARKMGAERLIVVATPAELKKNAELKSALDVAGQVTSLLIKKNEDEMINSLTENDVLIIPDIKGYTAGSFDKANELVAPGYVAAQKKLEALQKYRVSPAEYAALRQSQILAEPQKPLIAFIDINNQSGVSDKIIQSRIKAKTGAALDMAMLKKDLVTLSGTGYFDEILFDVVEKDGKSGIVITTFGPAEKKDIKTAEQASKAETTALNRVQFGLNLQDDFQGDSSYNLGFRFKRIPISRNGAELNADVQMGDQAKLQASLFQPLDNEARYFFEPYLGFEARNVSLFADNVQQSRYRLSRAGAGFKLGRQFGNLAEVSVGALRGAGYADLVDGVPFVADDDFEVGQYHITAEFDNLDNLRFPKKGMLARASFVESLKSWGASNEFKTFEAEFAFAKTWKANSLAFSATTKLNLEDNPPIQSRFFLGGFGNLSGYRPGELVASNYTLYRGTLYREWNKSAEAAIKLPLYMGLSLEAAGLFDKSSDVSLDANDHIFAGSVFVGTETIVGPIYLGYGQAEGGHRSFYLFLGRTF